MRRPLRPIDDGLIYHVINRGNNRQQVFCTEGDYLAFRRALGDLKQRKPFELHGYCLMSTRIHLVIRPLACTISRVVQSLLVSHTQRYHRFHGSGGHVWQGRFKSPVVQDDKHLLTLLCYVEVNPLRAKLKEFQRAMPHDETYSRRDVLRAAGITGASALAGAVGVNTKGTCAGAAEGSKPPVESEEQNAAKSHGVTIREEARQTPVVAECDLCVIGGSATGVFAAVAAARLGARVALVESMGYFGGVATLSLVNIWHSIFDTSGQRQIIAGLTMEVVERLKRRNAVNTHEPDRSRHFVLNSAELAIELDELVQEAGVRPFLHTRFVQPVLADDRVVAAVIEDKSGRRAVRARCFIDASGDGDLVARAGLPTRRDSQIQPPTTCAILCGLEVVSKQNKGFNLARAVFNPELPGALTNGFLWHAEVPGIPGASMVAGTRVHGADCSDADQLTRAEIEGRRQVRAICDIVRGHFAGGAAIGLAALPARIGIRESRHAECLHTLTETEILTGKRFPDAIANGTYRVDIHYPDRPGLVFRYLDGAEEYVCPGKPTRKGRWREPAAEDPTFYQVPYASLIPRGSRNVLVAGRLLDADRGAFGAARVMVNCNQMGQAAGTAAAISLKQGIDVGEVRPEELRETLADQGAIVI
ncbi:MAG: FAD-dependent oxidoreductase [Pirellulales bacterium]|nr:FAD-dependent oxidoreductase [Pirellulales bacterium]